MKNQVALIQMTKTSKKGGSQMGNTYISCFYGVHSVVLYLVLAFCTDLGMFFSVLIGDIPMFILCNFSLRLKHSEILDILVIAVVAFIEGFLLMSSKGASDMLCILSGFLMFGVNMVLLIAIRHEFNKVKE